jgi:putative oxidoreductase
MKKLFVWLMNPPTDGPKSILLVRLMAGGVFFWEGLLKFVYANQGVGRFTKLGIPFPHFTAPFIGCLEIVGGLLLLSGLMTRLIAVPFIAEMIVAILSTKISLYLGTSPLPLPAGSSTSRFLGRVARNPLRLRADSDRHFPTGERPGKVVAGCGAAA